MFCSYNMIEKEQRFEIGEEVKLLEAFKDKFGTNFVYGIVKSKKLRRMNPFARNFLKICYNIDLHSPDNYTHNVMAREQDEAVSGGSSYDGSFCCQKSAEAILPERRLDFWK